LIPAAGADASRWRYRESILPLRLGEDWEAANVMPAIPQRTVRSAGPQLDAMNADSRKSFKTTVTGKITKRPPRKVSTATPPDE
jgi:hypothetical protein